LATAQPGNPTTFPADDEETRKVLLAELLRGAAVIEFDNLVDDLLPHKSLCSSLTAEFLSGRILGVSKMATVSTRTLMLSSGNNVGPIADMARRCITIDLEPACETPATRTFRRPGLLQEVRGKREPFVTAALTIIRAWVVAGCPRMPSPPIASFGQWDAWCRQPLLWLDLADPATSLFAAMQEDPVRETLGRLLALWQQLFGRQPSMARDLIRKMHVAGPLADDLKELLGEIVGDHDVANARKLGRWLRRQEGRIVNGLKLVRASVKRNVECWHVESVMSVSSVVSPANSKAGT
jgi:hypothetical protein